MTSVLNALIISVLNALIISVLNALIISVLNALIISVLTAMTIFMFCLNKFLYRLWTISKAEHTFIDVLFVTMLITRKTLVEHLFSGMVYYVVNFQLIKLARRCSYWRLSCIWTPCSVNIWKRSSLVYWKNCTQLFPVNNVVDVLVFYYVQPWRYIAALLVGRNTQWIKKDYPVRYLEVFAPTYQ